MLNCPVHWSIKCWKESKKLNLINGNPWNWTLMRSAPFKFFESDCYGHVKKKKKLIFVIIFWFTFYALSQHFHNWGCICPSLKKHLFSCVSIFVPSLTLAGVRTDFAFLFYWWLIDFFQNDFIVHWVEFEVVLHVKHLLLFFFYIIVDARRQNTEGYIFVLNVLFQTPRLNITVGNGKGCSLRSWSLEGAVSLVWSHVSVHTERKHFYEEYLCECQAYVHN